MYQNEFKRDNPPEDCDVCETPITFYISNFRIDLNGPTKSVIFANNLLVTNVCIDCLTKQLFAWHAIQKKKGKAHANH